MAIHKLDHSILITDLLGVSDDCQVFVTNSVTYSYQYKTNFVLCCGFDTRDLPVFSLILNIFIYDKRAFFIVQQYNTVDYNNHLHSFEIKSNNAFDVLDIKSLYCPMPMERHQCHNSTTWFVTPRYLIL